jgi:hypothetical protein
MQAPHDLSIIHIEGSILSPDIRRVYLDILKSEQRWRDFAGNIKQKNLRRPALQEEFAKVLPDWQELS